MQIPRGHNPRKQGWKEAVSLLETDRGEGIYILHLILPFLSCLTCLALTHLSSIYTPFPSLTPSYHSISVHGHVLHNKATGLI